MGKQSGSADEKKRQKKAMKKKRKDAQRHKRGTTVASESAARYQMLTGFGQAGKMDNFIRNLSHLSEMFADDPDLKDLRFDAEACYGKFDLAADAGPLKSLYEAENALFLPEEDGDFWKGKRAEILPDLLTDEFIHLVSAKLNKLLQTKRGFKKEHRAIEAGKLMLDAHISSLTAADVSDNTLWEIILSTTLRENPRDLPEPPAEEESPAEPAEAAGSTGGAESE